MESPQPVSRAPTRASGRMEPCWRSYDSIWHGSYLRRHKCDECLWDQRRPCPTKRDMLEKPACEGGHGAVQTEQLFQRFLFCESASCRSGWHWNGIWEQRDRDRGRSRTSESGSRSFKNCDGQLADRKK